MCYPSYSTIPKKLIEHFGTPYNVFSAREEEYKEITSKTEPLMNKDLNAAMNVVEYIKSNNIGILTYNDPAFPSRLKRLNNCPLLLYYIGKLYDFDKTPSVGVVGTRNYTKQGERITKRISYDLARSGFTVVSGLAKGIDSFAHKAALYNKTNTTAVLGCGIDVIYPRENEELTLRIHENGLVITEFAPGTAPAATNFPARNRIISALSNAVFVAECTLKSGTIITADHAFRHDIPVYMYDSLCYDAAEYLKSKGAFSINNSDYITTVFKDTYPELKLIGELAPEKELQPEKIVINVKAPTKFKAFCTSKDKATKNTFSAKSAPVHNTAPPDYSTLDEDELEVIKLLEEKALCVDEMANQNLPVPKLLRVLTTLELKGCISSQAGGKYVINT